MVERVEREKKDREGREGTGEPRAQERMGICARGKWGSGAGKKGEEKGKATLS